MRNVTRWLPIVLFAAACSNPPENNSVVDPGQSTCERDQMNDPASAGELSVGESLEGFICPVEDEDWFKLTVPPGSALFGIELALSAQLSAVEISYALFSVSGGEPDVVVAQPPSTGIGQAHNYTHCVDPGEYLLVVRDSGNNAQDFRHPYTLTTTTRPDPDTNEPNGSAASATPIQIGTPQTGYVACRGDEDWYSIDIPDGQLLSIQLSSAVATYEPTVRVYDPAGELLVDETNPSGSVQPTDINRFQVLPGSGNYSIVVSDDDNEHADPNVPYTLTVTLVADSDPNEPNNHPDEATPLSATPVTCGADFGSALSTTGTIGSPGDDDWFVLPLSGCENGIIEATVELQTAGMSAAAQWELAAEVQASVTLVKPHAPSPCSADGDCTRLQAACDDALECNGLFETCLNDGLCAGATVCLPGGQCGANQTQRFYSCPPRLEECMPSATPPRPNAARLAAPLNGESAVYLRVGDFQSNGSAPDVPYTFTVRVRQDPDTNEPNNLYTNEIQNPLPVRAHQPFAVDVPVHDCVAGDCCGAGDWITGSIGYEFDLDWFRYDHPCPGEDCTVRVNYQVEAGPVDLVMNLFHGSSLWFTAFDIDEQPMQSAISGALGGTTAGDSCFYAFNGHGNDYYLLARDLNTLYPDGENIRPESRDWDANQTYSFCVEKVSNTCSVPPCSTGMLGCDSP